MKLRTFATTLATAAALTLAAPAWAGYVFSFSALPNPAHVDDIVSVDVQVANDPHGFNFLGFDLQFDSSILEFQTAAGGGLLADEFFDAFEALPGVVTTLLSDDLLASTFSSGTVATFTFKAIGVGVSGLDVDLSTAFATDDFLVDRSDFTATSGSVEVLPRVTNGVPVPGTLLLAGLGLALLGGTRWRGSSPPAAR